MASNRGLRLAGLALALAVIAAASQPSAVRAAFEKLLWFIELGGEPVLASFPVISDHEIEELKLAPSQEQAERLLERAVNGYRGAAELIESQLDSWHGEIKMDERLDALFRVAIDSSNLRVRAAAIEIYLAAHKVEKTSEQVEYFKGVIRENPNEGSWYLWVLGTAYRLTGQIDSAIGAFEAAIKRDADELPQLVGLVSTLGELGREKDAKTSVTEILRLDPDFSIKTYMRGLFYRDPAESARFEDGLRKSGLPE